LLIFEKEPEFFKTKSNFVEEAPSYGKGEEHALQAGRI